MKSPPWYLLLPVVLTSIATLVPVAYLVYYAMTSTEDVEHLWAEAMRLRMWRTLSLTLGVSLCAAVLGAILSWLTVRTDLVGCRLISVLAVCPLAVPPYVTAYSLLSLGGDDGLLIRLLGEDSSVLRFLFTEAETGRFHVPRISGYWGSLCSLTVYNLPYIYLPLRAAMHSLDPSLEEVARSLGRSRMVVGLRIVAPQLLPALLAGVLLVSLHVMADFGVVSLMRYDTLSTALYARFNSFDTGNAARLAMVLVAMAAALMVGEFLLLRHLRVDRIGVGASRSASRIRLGWKQGPSLLLCWTIFLVGVALPIATTNYWMANLTDTSIWSNVFQNASGSIQASFLAAVGAVAVAIPIAVLGVRYPGRVSSVLARLPLVGYAVPALALGLSLIVLCLSPWTPDAIFRVFYQSLPLLVLAYMFHFLAEALGPIRSSLMLSSPRLEEASLALGVSRLQTLFRVTIPVLRHGIIVALALVFLSCMKELPLTILLAPMGMETLARNAWDHAENAEFARAAPYALTILGTSAVFVGLLLFEGRSRR